MEKDMTVGNPTKMILNFTVPLFIGNVFQQLYQVAGATASSQCVIPPLFSKKVAVFKFMMYC